MISGNYFVNLEKNKKNRGIIEVDSFVDDG